MLTESNWTWLAGGWGNMADLAERVDDLICSFDSSADATMDTLSMLIFGWMLLGLVILCVGKFIYNRIHQHGKQAGMHAAGQTIPVPSAAGHHAAPKDSTHSAAAGLHVIGESVVLLGAGASASGVAAAVARSRSANASKGAGSAGGGGGGGAAAAAAGAGIVHSPSGSCIRTLALHGEMCARAYVFTIVQ